MRRSDFLMKLMSVILLVGIVVYIAVYIYDKTENPLKTTVAVRYTAEESGDADGYIIRTEDVLDGDGATVTLMASEGEKLATGQALAVSYEGDAALQRASQIRALQLQISAAEADADNATAEKKAVSADDSVLALSSAVQHGSLEALPSLTYNIENLIFTQSVKAPDIDLNALKDELNGLLAQNTDTRTIPAPVSGIFSAVVDGYESVGPDALQNLTPSSLEALFPPEPKPAEDVLGKLITNIAWYYAAIVDQSTAEKLRAIVDQAAADKKAAAADLQFTKTYNAKLTMKIESVGADENGKSVVVFSSKANLSDTTALRKLTAQVLFDSCSGLLVPKEAVYTEESDDGDKAYVYLLTGLQAERVDVTILAENGDSYVVQDGAENNTVLREGCDIIVKAKDLYNGKVVGR
ncbi:hypothetical protein SAMN02745823_03339 [Sporobacter termitidis DSM 10068]|uniref:Membrane fusion protein n=1 Tax=Sporobacter termitidis DSM 10068 TaxID=1123282 RepID=A0A1M5Z796_9FIRM|nr:HlyD family efflux transporter periplasmic adaptor subunit [Sporobacter termitidis]SHI20109.1 hypothetical protein SAMN02745823_03339 [Sporobacter termitidis DSM 10068]